MTDFPDHVHVDVDEAADFDEGLLDAAASARVSAAVASCATCAATLDAVTRAHEALAGLGSVTLPQEVADRLDAALAAEASAARVPGGATTVTAFADRRRRWWLPVAAGVAAVGVLALVVPAVVHSKTNSATAAARATVQAAGASSSANVPAGPPEASSGSDYATGAAEKLSAALAGPRLPAAARAGAGGSNFSAPNPAAAISVNGDQSAEASPPPAGSPGAVHGTSGTGSGSVDVKGPDVYAALRDPATIEACAERLTGQQPAAAPLLIDYALSAGRPAVALFYPSDRAGQVDVYIVGTGCGATTDELLKFVRVPAG
ncbi:MAG: hypothetical protein QOI42_929 [Frankiaceae bacterium]|nr:hypothetical protein [Frankiaceae bacterium]